MRKQSKNNIETKKFSMYSQSIKNLDLSAESGINSKYLLSLDSIINKTIINWLGNVKSRGCLICILFLRQVTMIEAAFIIQSKSTRIKSKLTLNYSLGIRQELLCYLNIHYLVNSNEHEIWYMELLMRVVPI